MSATALRMGRTSRRKRSRKAPTSSAFNWWAPIRTRRRKGWTVWGNQASEDYRPDWDTYAYTSRSLAAE